VIIDPGNRKTLRCHGVKIIATSEMANSFTWFCADGLWIAIAASVPFAINVEISFEIADLESANHIVALKEAEHFPLMQERFPSWLGTSDPCRIEYWQSMILVAWHRNRRCL
jgi:hypothetical protein